MSLSGMSACPLTVVVAFGFFCGLIVRWKPRPVGPTIPQSTLSPMEHLLRRRTARLTGRADAASLWLVCSRAGLVLSARAFSSAAVSRHYHKMGVRRGNAPGDKVVGELPKEAGS